MGEYVTTRDDLRWLYYRTVVDSFGQVGSDSLSNTKSKSRSGDKVPSW